MYPLLQSRTTPLFRTTSFDDRLNDIPEKISGGAPAFQTRDIPINSDEIASPSGHVWAIFPDSVKLWYWSILLNFSSLERPVVLDQDSKSCYYPSKPCRRSRRTYECEVLEVEGAQGGARWTLGCAKNPVSVRADPFTGACPCHGEGDVLPPSLSVSRASQMAASDWQP